ncbi:MAG: hypothetical protein RRY69_02975, partial [Oscillospiraceae bacterium]
MLNISLLIKMEHAMSDTALNEHNSMQVQVYCLKKCRIFYIYGRKSSVTIGNFTSFQFLH